MINWNEVGLVIVGLVGSPVVTTWLVKKFGKDAPKVVQAAVTVVDEGIQLVKDLAKTPWFAGVAATTELKVHHVVATLEDTTLGKVAATGIAAFGNDLDKMTVIQKANLSEWVKAELKKFEVMVSDQQVMAALQVAQTAVDKVRAEILPAVQKQDAAVQAWAANAQTSVQPPQIATAPSA